MILLQAETSGMTTLEIILSFITGIATLMIGGKYLWEYLKSKNANITKLKLTRLEQDEADIRNLKSQYVALEAKYNLLEQKSNQVEASLRVILPLLEKLAEDDPAIKAALEVVKEIVISNK